MSEIYQDGSYLEENPDWHVQDSPWKAQNILKILRKNEIEATRVCEIGCGAGEILFQLSHQMGRDTQFHGFEISPQAYELCQKRRQANLSFHLKNLLDEETDPFDVLLAIDVFEHVPDYMGFLTALRSKADFKVFHIPLDMTVQGVVRMAPIMKARHRIGHLHYFCKETALATLKDTGYEIVDFFYTKGSLELPDRSFKSDLLKLPRKVFFSINQDLAVRTLGGFSLMVLAH